MVDVVERQKRILISAILISLALHGVWILGLQGLSRWAPKPAAAPEEVTIFLPPPRETRIVESTAGQKVETAKEDAFLGEANRVVEKETVGKTSGLAPSPTRKARRQARAKPKAAGPLSNFGVAMLPPVAARPQAAEDRGNWARNEEDSSQYNDYIKGLKQSETTALNTREFMFFGYYQRIRQRLDMAWRPFLREEIVKIARQGRSLATDKDHITRTLVVLNRTGEIIQVKVLEESGTRSLDEAAVKAFNAAGPFPNPPQALVGSRETIEIRWDFVLRT